MSPELIQLIINAVFLGYAYLWAYPKLTERTLRAIMIRDMAISAAVLTVSWLLFAGKSIGFSLLFFETNWLVFTLVTMCVMETPLFVWFANKYGISFNDLDGQ